MVSCCTQQWHSVLRTLPYRCVCMYVFMYVCMRVCLSLHSLLAFISQYTHMTSGQQSTIPPSDVCVGCPSGTFSNTSGPSFLPSFSYRGSRFTWSCHYHTCTHAHTHTRTHACVCTQARSVSRVAQAQSPFPQSMPQTASLTTARLAALSLDDSTTSPRMHVCVCAYIVLNVILTSIEYCR